LLDCLKEIYEFNNSNRYGWRKVTTNVQFSCFRVPSKCHMYHHFVKNPDENKFWMHQFSPIWSASNLHEAICPINF
jgi:hypothetical protein